MKAVLDYRAHASALRTLGVWLALTAPVAVMAGSASALFLGSLDRVTALRFALPWLLLLLPVIGPVIVWLYEKHGRGAGRGTDLLLDEIHRPGAGVPVRMAPLVLLSTLLTHLFGGSAARFSTTPGHGYRLQPTEALGTDGWITLLEAPPRPVPQKITFTDAAVATASRYYRVLVATAMP